MTLTLEPSGPPEAGGGRPSLESAKDAFSRGELGEALRVLAELDEMNGPRSDVARFRAGVYFFSGEYDAALSEITMAIVYATGPGKPAPASLIVRKAEILNRMGRGDDAIWLLEGVSPELRKGDYFRILRESVKTKSDIIRFENVAAPNFARKDLTFSAAMNNYSILLREMGDPRAGILVARDRFLKIKRAFKYGRLSKPTEKPGWVDEAKICLADLKRHFSRGGVEFFLISGVFLGAVRDGAIIGHDKDIDVGVDEAVGLDRVKDLFRQSKTFVIREIPSQRSVYLLHCSGVKVDVFMHYHEYGRYWHEGPKVRWWNSPFNLSPLPFLDETYLAPANADRYLSENYGAWRTPVSEFETFVDTPNMEIVNFDHMRWYYLARMSEYYLQGRKPQFERVWEALGGLYNADDQLKRAAKEVIETDFSMTDGARSRGRPARGMTVTGVLRGFVKNFSSRSR